MSETKQTDRSQIESPPLTPEEIKDIEDFRASDKDKMMFDTPEKAIKWLHEFKE